MKKDSVNVGTVIAWVTLALLIAMGLYGFFLILRAIITILSK